MDLSLTTEEAAFRDECRTWLRDNLPWDYGTGLPPMFDDLAGEVAFLRDWQRRLAGAGLVGVTWPVEFGGRGADPMHHYLVQEELARARAQLKSATLMTLESTASRSEQVARQLQIFDRVVPINEVIENIENVDATAIKRTAARMIATTPTLAALGQTDKLADYKAVVARLN